MGGSFEAKWNNKKDKEIYKIYVQNGASKTLKKQIYNFYSKWKACKILDANPCINTNITKLIINKIKTRRQHINAKTTNLGFLPAL